MSRLKAFAARGIGLTWEQVRSRSERAVSSEGTTWYCSDCAMHWAAKRVPCLRHTRKSERAARAVAVGCVR